MAIDLSGPRAKLDRAREHRDALESEVFPVFKGERYPIQLSAKLDPDSGYHVFRVAETPSEWLLRVAILLGDIAHNLRSGLDQLAWQLVVNHSGRPLRPTQKTNIEFPIKYSRQALRSTYTFSKVAPFDRTIIEASQPYKGGGKPKLHALPVIQQLSNRDKHRVVHPTLVATHYITVEGTVLEGKGIFDIDWEVTGSRKNLKVGTELMRCVLPSGVDNEVKVAGYAAPDVKLPQRNTKIFIVVDSVIGFVEAVINQFVSHYGV